MANTILLKRGTSAKNNVYTGPEGEVTVDIEVKTLRVQDGVTAGGTALAKAVHVHAISDVSNLSVSLNGKADVIHTHTSASTSVSGFMSATDKTKLDGIEANANNYVHPTSDGSLHVPATGTTNNTKVLKAGATAGSISWGTVAFSEIGTKPTTLSGYGIADAAPLASPALTGTPTAPTAAAGTNTTQLATTAFVQAATDAARQGLNVKDAVRVATEANLTASYASQVLTNTGTLAALSIDGVVLAVGDRVLVKNQTTGTQNGIYTVTTVGSASVAWVLTRATDANTSSELPTGTFVFVSEGTVNSDAGFALATNAPITLDTTALTWTQFSGAGQITAGTGLTKNGNTIDVATASTSRIVVNADSIDLATTGITGGTYRSLTVDAYGRATAGTNPTTLAGYGITDAAPIASPALTGTPTAPTAAAGTNTTQLATTAFVQAATDAARQGLNVKDAVRVATEANLTASYASQVLTNTGTLAALSIDGVVLAVGDRVLVKNQTTGTQNGIYTVTTVGSASVAWVLTRATDANTSSELPTGTFVFVSEGTVNSDAGFALATNAPITLDTTALTWTQFSGAGQITAGAGLAKTGNTIDITTASTGRIVVNPDNIDLATTGITGGTYRSITIDIYGRATAGTNPTTLSGYGITDAAPLASPSLTGTPTAPTAALGTNTTQLATTAFVQSEISVIDGGVM